MSQDKKVVHVTVEEDPAWLSAYGAKRDSRGHALYSAITTLTLGVLGSTILPVPYAFSKIGILVGILTMLVVAAVNDVTCCMLIRAAAITGCYSYEELAEWAGGKRARVVTQASLILLLYGTMCGGLAFLSDVARIMVQKGMPGHAPELLERDGRPVMLAVVLLVLFPLCLQRHIRQFEKAASVGVVIVVTLSAIIIYKAAALGFPAVRSGELHVFSLKVDSSLPEAFSVLGFAFYMQPMLMPVLKELPRGPVGVAVSERAVHVVLFCAACAAYGTVGIFGASIFGEATESNIMVNDILEDSRATLVLYAALILYLCCGMVTSHYALRASVDTLLVGANAPYAPGRQFVETVCILSAAAAVAVAFPTQAEKIFAFTGCTAVCLACYMIPVYIHFTLESRLEQAWREKQQQQQQQGGLEGAGSGGLESQRELPFTLEEEVLVRSNGINRKAASLNGEANIHTPLLQASRGIVGSPRRCCGGMLRFVQPALVLAVGVGCSLAGLWVAGVDFYRTYFVPEGTGPATGIADAMSLWVGVQLAGSGE